MVHMSLVARLCCGDAQGSQLSIGNIAAEKCLSFTRFFFVRLLNSGSLPIHAESTYSPPGVCHTLYLYWAPSPCNASLLFLRLATFWSTLNRGKILQEVLKLSRLIKKQEQSQKQKHGYPVNGCVLLCCQLFWHQRSKMRARLWGQKP